MKKLLISIVVSAFIALGALTEPSAFALKPSFSDGTGKNFEIAIRIEGITFTQLWSTIKPGDYHGKFSFDCDTNGWRNKHAIDYDFTIEPRKNGLTMLNFHWTDGPTGHGQEEIFIEDGPPDFTPITTWDHHFMVRACYTESSS